MMYLLFALMAFVPGRVNGAACDFCDTTAYYEGLQGVSNCDFDSVTLPDCDNKADLKAAGDGWKTLCTTEATKSIYESTLADQIAAQSKAANDAGLDCSGGGGGGGANAIDGGWTPAPIRLYTPAPIAGGDDEDDDDDKKDGGDAKTESVTCETSVDGVNKKCDGDCKVILERSQFSSCDKFCKAAGMTCDKAEEDGSNDSCDPDTSVTFTCAGDFSEEDTSDYLCTCKKSAEVEDGDSGVAKVSYMAAAITSAIMGWLLI